MTGPPTSLPLCITFVEFDIDAIGKAPLFEVLRDFLY